MMCFSKRKHFFVYRPSIIYLFLPPLTFFNCWRIKRFARLRIYCGISFNFKKGEKMKKLLSLAILLSGIGFGAFAQDGTKKVDREKKSYVRKEYVRKDMVKLTPEQMAEKRTEMLGKQLNLTEKQRKDVYKLQLDQAKSIKKKQEIRKSERELARKERLEQRQKLESLLTAEQKEILKNKMAKRSDVDSKRGKERRKDFQKGEPRRKMDRTVGS